MSWITFSCYVHVGRGSAGLAVTIVGCVGVVLGGCDAPLVVTFLTLAALGIAAGPVTFNLGAIDIAPNYAGLFLPL